MVFDFNQETDRISYLNNKMDDLLDGINDSYGRLLMDELISRMDKTVIDFNEEVTTLTNQLKENTEKKIELLKNIKNAKPDDEIPEEDVPVENAAETSAWERRLETLSK